MAFNSGVGGEKLRVDEDVSVDGDQPP
jgi:hypothetical protein